MLDNKDFNHVFIDAFDAMDPNNLPSGPSEMNEVMFEEWRFYAF